MLQLVQKRPDGSIPAILTSKCSIVNLRQNYSSLVEEMFFAMEYYGGCGLAAPQVGIPLRIFVVSITGKAQDGKAYLNPKIILSEGETEAIEGCLSLPGEEHLVKRPKHVKIRAYDSLGVPFQQEDSETLARIWQHELDHLDGYSDDFKGLIQQEFKTVLKLLNFPQYLH